MIAPKVPPACVAPLVVSRAVALSAQLPELFSSYYLEFRLSAREEQVDLLACVSAPRDGDHLSRIAAAVERLSGDLARGPVWGFARDVLRRWASPDSGWAERAPCLWLEFDHVGTRPTAEHAPSIWICVDRGYPNVRASSARWDPREAYATCLDLLTPALPPAFEGLASERNQRTLEACFLRLPPEGRIVHASFMLARSPATIKIYGSVPRHRLASYLDDLGWSGPRDMLREALRTFHTPETADDTAYFDLALDGDLLPYVAIAFSQLQLDGPARADPRRSALLRLLEDHGLSAPEKRAALGAWPGSARESHPTTSARARVDRWLDAKITLHSEHGIAAKGYLGFAPVLAIF